MILELSLVLGLTFAAALMPPRRVALLLGVILPIDYLSVLDSITLDAMRYALLAVLIVRVRRDRTLTGHPLFVLGIAGLVLVALFDVLKGADGSAYTLQRGLIGLLSALAAFLVAQRSEVHKPLVRGFVLGVSASAIDVCLQVAGLPYAGATSVYGFRYSGFSFKSTTLAPLLALAIVFVLTNWLWPAARTRSDRWILMMRLTLLLPLGAALYASQGRGGVLSLALALVFLLAVRFKGHPGRILTLGLVGVLVAWYLRSDIAALFVRPTEDDLSNGRGSLNEEAWDAFTSSPVFGPPPAVLSGLNPHTPFLTFAIEAGILGLLVAVVLAVGLVRVVLTPERTGNALPVAVRCGALVMFTTSFLEPDGFYIGLARVVLLAVVLTTRPDAPAGTERNFEARRPIVEHV